MSAYGAHLGIFKTIQKIRSTFIWLKMDADIRAHICSCEVCTFSKPALNTNLDLLAFEVPTCPMERLYINFIGTLSRSKSGNSYALVLVDGFSKFSWIFPLRGATTARAVAASHSIFSWTGPLYLLYPIMLTSLRIYVSILELSMLPPPRTILSQIFPSSLTTI